MKKFNRFKKKLMKQKKNYLFKQKLAQSYNNKNKFNNFRQSH